MTVLKTETETAVFSRNTDRVLTIQNRNNTICIKLYILPLREYHCMIGEAIH